MGRKPLLVALLLVSFFVVIASTISSSEARSFPNAGSETTQAAGRASGSIAFAAVLLGKSSESEWMDHGLMGMTEDKCEEEEEEKEKEECVKRRVILEVHLDYIYTQKQPPH